MRKIILIEKEQIPQNKPIFGLDIDISNQKKFLGRTIKEDIFYDCSKGLFPDSFAAIANTLADGHNLYLYLPESYPNGDPDNLKKLDFGISHQELQNNFNQRLRQIIINTDAKEETTEDIKQIHIEFSSKHPQCFLGLRGSGKSSLLKEKIIFLLKQNIQPIIICSAYLNNLEILRKILELNAEFVYFLPPDELIRRNPPAKAVIIDEAAAIAPQQLLKICKLYPFFTIATTTENYEGSANNFRINVLKELNLDKKHIYQLNNVYRFNVRDHISLCLNKIFCKNNINFNFINGNIKIKLENQNDLVKNENRLAQIVNLLADSHYRNRPSDLKYMLDLPDVFIFTANDEQNQVVGVCQIKLERPIANDLAKEIIANKRRPQGRICMQKLLIHTQDINWAKKNIARIQRIAVREQLRRNKIGLNLINHVQKYFPNHTLASIFSYQKNTAEFWKSCGFNEIYQTKTIRSKNHGQTSLIVKQYS